MNDNGENSSGTVKVRWIDRIFGGDKAIWVIVIFLVIVSVFVAYSSMAYKEHLTSTEQLIKQLKLTAIGLVCLFSMQYVPYQLYRRVIKIGYIGALGLTVAMLFFGTKAGGVARSLNLFGIDFQPFELLKIMVVLMLADSLAKRQKIIDTTPMIPSLWIMDWVKDSQRNVDILVKHTIPLLAPMVIACCVTIWTSNSTTLIIAASCFIMLFLGRVRMVDLSKLMIVFMVAGAVAMMMGGRSETGSSRLSKLDMNMLVKHAVVEDDGVEYYSNDKETDQSTNAKMSIAMGRIIGRGPGMSTNRSILQKPDSDMVYAFLIEEYGALGGGLILLAFLVFFYRAITIFKQCGTAFPSLVVLGLSMMIVFQAIMNMMVSVALFPITGQQLPIISRGGSSLMFMMLSIGMILGISRQMQRRTLDRPNDESLLEKK